MFQHQLLPPPQQIPGFVYINGEGVDDVVAVLQLLADLLQRVTKPSHDQSSSNGCGFGENIILYFYLFIIFSFSENLLDSSLNSFSN